MFLVRADPLRGQVGGGWALEIETILGPDMATSELGPRNRDFFGPWNGNEGIERHLAPKKSRFPGPNPLPPGPIALGQSEGAREQEAATFILSCI